jgi:DNA-binding MarR family transcriptional regulator
MYNGAVDALELIILGRQLTRIGEEVMRDSNALPLPTGPALVLGDVLAHPDSSIGEVSGRTGLPQSYASESVARLREEGILETTADPTDGRKTLVRLTGRHMRTVAKKGAVSVDAALATALGESDSKKLQSILRSLGELSSRLRPSEPGPFARQLKAAESSR